MSKLVRHLSFNNSKRIGILVSTQNEPNESPVFVRAYLQASKQNRMQVAPERTLKHFVSERGLHIAAFYVENESGASLQRPELFRLLSDCRLGDILLIEQVDCLSRLNAEDWEKLKEKLQARRVRVVTLDLSASWIITNTADEMTTRMMEALNGMMLDMLAAIARKAYTDRRRRQQGLSS